MSIGQALPDGIRSQFSDHKIGFPTHPGDFVRQSLTY